MQYVLSAIIAIVFTIGSYWSIQPEQKVLSPEMQVAIQQYVDESLKTPAFGTTLPIAGQTYNLAGSGVSQSATSITLASFTLPQNGYKIQDADLSSTFYVTLEPGNSTRQEIVSCTTDVQNANGSATFSGCTRGLSPITPYTASSSLKFSHGGGTQVIFSNPPQLYNEFLALANTATSTAILTFSSTTPPRLDFVAAQGTGTYIATTSEFATVDYVNKTTLSGAANSTTAVKGIVEMATASEGAASTALGGTGASLVLGANIATSSPTAAGCPTFCVAGAVAGKLSQLFLDLTADWTFSTGLVTFSGGATSTGTTTISASSLTQNPFKINGLVYKYPSVRGASSTVAMENGSGSLTWNLPPITVLYNNPNVNLTSSSAASTTVLSVTVPANTLNTSNKAIRIHAVVTNPGAGTTCGFDLKYGSGTATSSFGYTFLSNSGNIGMFDGMIYATSSSVTFLQSTSQKNMAYGFQILTASNVIQAQISTSTAPITAATYIAIDAKASADICQVSSATIELITQ